MQYPLYFIISWKVSTSGIGSSKVPRAFIIASIPLNNSFKGPNNLNDFLLRVPSSFFTMIDGLLFPFSFFTKLFISS